MIWTHKYQPAPSDDGVNKLVYWKLVVYLLSVIANRVSMILSIQIFLLRWDLCLDLNKIHRFILIKILMLTFFLIEVKHWKSLIKMNSQETSHLVTEYRLQPHWKYLSHNSRSFHSRNWEKLIPLNHPVGKYILNFYQCFWNFKNLQATQWMIHMQT